jgi:excisionase family DNA binding protein
MSQVQRAARDDLPRFYQVAEVAHMLGMSSMTLYRAIAEGEFPAVRVRGRLAIPAQAIEEMAALATSQKTVVDAADWAVVQAATS